MLTSAFVLLGEVLIYVPSIARFRLVYLEERIAAAHLATMSLEAAGAAGIDGTLENELLSHAGVLSVTLREPSAELMLGKLPPVQKVFDLRDASPDTMIGDAFSTLWHGGNRMIRVIGTSPQRPEVLVDVSLREQPMWRAMVDYSWRILNLSIVISLLTAFLVYAALQLMIVRPLRRITESVIAFRDRPEDAGVELPVSQAQRRDRAGAERARPDAEGPARGAGAKDPSRRARRRGRQDQPRPAQPSGQRHAAVRPARSEPGPRGAAGHAAPGRGDGSGGAGCAARP